MKLRASNISDNDDIRAIHISAFGAEKGPVIADLAIDLLTDATAMPLLSLVAEEKGQLIGHIIFTKASIFPNNESISAQILGPLAVAPDTQNQGVGGKLIQAGLKQLRQTGVDIVFVLGHPDYYPRTGFTPAGANGFEAPYPIPEEHAAAWMVQELKGGLIGQIKGKVRCSEALNQPEHWRE